MAIKLGFQEWIKEEDHETQEMPLSELKYAINQSILHDQLNFVRTHDSQKIPHKTQIMGKIWRKYEKPTIWWLRESKATSRLKRITPFPYHQKINIKGQHLFLRILKFN